MEYELTGRQKSLIDRGYSKEEVINISSFTKEEFDFACDIAFEKITHNVKRVEKPKCTFIGGQPGSGKSVMTMAIKSIEDDNGIVEIGIDNYRMFHPKYRLIEKTIKEHWKNRIPNENDSPGNDIADFTHQFAGMMTDELINRTTKKIDNKSYNLLLEWGMREPTSVIKTLRMLAERNYTNIINLIMIHKDISYEACNLRSDIMNMGDHIIRRVPKYFHDLCIESLPESINKIYDEAFKKSSLIAEINLILRDGKIVWNSVKDKTMPGEVLKEYLNSYELTKNFKNSIEGPINSYLTEANTKKAEYINLKNALMHDFNENKNIKVA